jgi:hypothetical protein
VSVSGKVRDANGRSTLDANLAAQTLGRVKFCYPDWVNGGVPWGLAGGAPASLTCTDVNGRYTWALTWPAVPGSSFEVR